MDSGENCVDSENTGNTRNSDVTSIRDFNTGNLSKSLLIIGAIGIMLYIMLSASTYMATDSWEGTIFNANASFGIFNFFMVVFIFGIILHFIHLQFEKLDRIADELDEELYVPDEEGEETLTEEELAEEEAELDEV